MGCRIDGAKTWRSINRDGGKSRKTRFHASTLPYTPRTMLINRIEICLESRDFPNNLNGSHFAL